MNVDMICWECDYPHSDSSWPQSPEAVWKQMQASNVLRRGHRQDLARERDAPLQVRPVLGARQGELHVGALRAQAEGWDVSIVARGIKASGNRRRSTSSSSPRPTTTDYGARQPFRVHGRPRRPLLVLRPERALDVEHERLVVVLGVERQGRRAPRSIERGIGTRSRPPGDVELVVDIRTATSCAARTAGRATSPAAWARAPRRTPTAVLRRRAGRPDARAGRRRRAPSRGSPKPVPSGWYSSSPPGRGHLGRGRLELGPRAHPGPAAAGGAAWAPDPPSPSGAQCPLLLGVDDHRVARLAAQDERDDAVVARRRCAPSRSRHNRCSDLPHVHTSVAGGCDINGPGAGPGAAPRRPRRRRPPLGRAPAPTHPTMRPRPGTASAGLRPRARRPRRPPHPHRRSARGRRRGGGERTPTVPSPSKTTTTSHPRRRCRPVRATWRRSRWSDAVESGHAALVTL